MEHTPSQNGLTQPAFLAGGVGTRAIVGTPPLRELASKVMKDVIRAANADLGGRDSIDDSFHDLMFQLTDVMGDYNSSTVLDLRAGLPLETHYLFSRPLARARQLGVLVPYMESVVLAVEGVTKFRGLEAAPQGE
jgi:ketopantoate reductase